jgi:hypothetical protein
MIEILKDLPENVIGFKATGKVTRADYEQTVMPAVNEHEKKFTKLNYLLWLDTDVSNFTMGAWVDDALLGLKHFTHWHKVAIVSHSHTIAKITDVFGHLVPGIYKGFTTEDLQKAITWLSQP